MAPDASSGREDELDLGDAASRNSSMSPASGIRVGLETCVVSPRLIDDLVGDVRGRLRPGRGCSRAQPLLDDLHVEHAQKAATEAEPEGVGAFRFREREARVVERELLSAVRRSSNWLCVAGKRPQKDDGDRLLIPGSASAPLGGDSVRVSPMFDVGRAA